MHFGDKNIDTIYTDNGEKLVVKKAAGEWDDSKSENLIGLLPAVGNTGDPVKIYMREMGLVSLLSREGEVELAKEIDAGARESMEAVFSANISIKDVVNIGARLKSGEIHVNSVLDDLDDEDGNIEEDMHRERVIKLLDKVTVYDAKNDVIRKKLNAKGLSPLERQKLKEDLDKNLLNIVKICRKVRFSKQQIHTDDRQSPRLSERGGAGGRDGPPVQEGDGSFPGPVGRGLGDDAQVHQKRGASGQKSAGIPGEIEVLRADRPGGQPPVQEESPRKRDSP